MKRSTTVQHREAQWRDHVARQEQSGQSVTAFCKSEGLAAQTFYWWRARLRKDKSRQTGKMLSKHVDAPFVDLGVLTSPQVGDAHSNAANYTIRLDLPGGIVLTIARH